MLDILIVCFMKFNWLKSKNLIKQLFGLAIFTSSQHAWSTDLVAYNAFYSISLGTVREGSDFIDAKGNVSLSVERTCKGWIMSQTLRMSLTTRHGSEFVQNLRFTGWESNDGSRYNFFSSNIVDGVRNDSRGFALKGNGNESGNASYRIPEEFDVSSPKGTFFPLGHTKWLIGRALAGERHVSNTLFDGTHMGVQRVVAFIGEKKLGGQQITKDQGTLLGPLSQRPGWKIRLGFYDLQSKDSVPSYELEILQLDNGVTPSLELEYQDFSLLFTQERLNEVSLPDCK